MPAPGDVLVAWGEFWLRHLEGLGHSRKTPIGRLMAGEIRQDGATFESRIPNGVDLPNLREFLIVEKVLDELPEKFRETALVEYVAPLSEVGRTAKQRAAYLGLSPGGYNDRLQRLKRRLREVEF